MLNTTGGRLVTWTYSGSGTGAIPDITALAPGGGLGYFATMFALCVASPNTILSGWNFNVDMSYIPVT